MSMICVVYANSDEVHEGVIDEPRATATDNGIFDPLQVADLTVTNAMP